MTSVLRLYAAALMLVVWAALTNLVGDSNTVVIIRLLSMAAAVTLTVRETVRINADRKRHRGR